MGGGRGVYSVKYVIIPEDERKAACVSPSVYVCMCVCVYLQSQINYTVHSFYISKEETIMKPGSLPFLPLDKALHQSASLTILYT